MSTAFDSALGSGIGQDELDYFNAPAGTVVLGGGSEQQAQWDAMNSNQGHSAASGDTGIQAGNAGNAFGNALGSGLGQEAVQAANTPDPYSPKNLLAGAMQSYANQQTADFNASTNAIVNPALQSMDASLVLGHAGGVHAQGDLPGGKFRQRREDQFRLGHVVAQILGVQPFQLLVPLYAEAGPLLVDEVW